MAKVTVKETPLTPSQKVIADAQREVEVTGPSGRTYTLRRSDLVSQFWFVDAVGPQTASNQPFMLMATPMLYISKIDGEPRTMVKTRMQFDALLAKVGDDFSFIFEAVQEHFVDGNGQLASEEGQQTLKN